ncbi:uncharacterized protein LOC134278088 isoform X4 [Saccostrea cucullata]|uniref:uncharacterized protein LOC134278088 isoform X4 n=1 Tax=Saccostrea cuccullata TaxID=36930 RepID=UPI002ED2FD2F
MSNVNQEIVLLMMGIGVVEVTIIIVRILAVKRFRQHRKSSRKRTSKEVNDRRPVSRKTVFGIDNVYDTIPFDESNENPYKDFSEGVYDTTSIRLDLMSMGKGVFIPGEASFCICFINQTVTEESQ